MITSIGRINQMELPEILAKMAEPEKLVEPNEMVLLNQYISGFITDYELQYDEAKLAYSYRWEAIKYEATVAGKPRSDKQTEIQMMRDPIATNLYKIKRTLSELKRYRQDLNRRIEVVMGIFWTTDMGLATAIGLQYPMHEMNVNDVAKVAFGFIKSPELEEYLASYWAKKLVVEPQAFYSELLMLRKRINQELHNY